MDITCPQCKTEYEFEDDKVTEKGITVKCTNCSYMFKVRRRAVAETEPLAPAATPAPAPAAPAEAAEPAREAASRPWMIRQSRGGVLQFKELTTLQQWIVERKVSRDDQISRSGDTWKRLGDIAELASFFQVVDAAVAAERDSGAQAGARASAASSSYGSAAAQNTFSDAAPRQSSTDDEPAFAKTGARFRSVGPSAAWETTGGGRVGEPGDDDDLLNDALPRRNVGKVISMLLVLALLGGGGVVAYTLRDRIAAFFSRGGGERSDASYRAGRTLYLKDDPASFAAADAEFAKAPKEHVLPLSGRAEVLVTWAEHLREEAALIKRKAKRLEDGRMGAAAGGATPAEGTAKPQPATAAPQSAEVQAQVNTLQLKASKLDDDATRKLGDAEKFVTAAVKQGPDKGEAHRAMADYLRVSGGATTEIKEHLDKAKQSLPDDPETMYIEASQALAAGDAAKGEELLKRTLAKTRARYGKSLLRATFRLALVMLEQNRPLEATELAQQILQSNAEHPWATLLLDEARAAAQASPPSGGQPAGPGATPPNVGSPGVATPTPPTKTPEPTPGGEKADRGDDGSGGGRQSYDALVRQGAKLSESGRTAKAFKLFERALKLNASGPEALTGIAYCHLDEERTGVAITFFQRALRASPAYGDALIGMAEAYKTQLNFKQALDYYKAYLRSAPGGSKAVMARRNISELERKVGPSDGAGSPTPAPAPGGGTPPAPGGGEPSAPTPPPSETPAPAPPASDTPAPAPSSPSGGVPDKPPAES